MSEQTLSFHEVSGPEAVALLVKYRLSLLKGERRRFGMRRGNYSASSSADNRGEYIL